jgi:polyhydroxybutyrate depolymerase
MIGLLLPALLAMGCAAPLRESRGAAQATAGAGQAVRELAPGDYVEEIASSGQARHYRVHIPPAYQPSTPIPLVIDLHGLNSNAAQQERLSGMSRKADAAGFIVVYPEGLGDPQTWHFGPGAEGAADLAFTRDLIVGLEQRLGVDSARIYATGISNGAQMANRMGCEMADVVAAIAPVSGGYFRAQRCDPSRPVPVIAFHGTADRVLPYEGQGQLLLPVRDWAANWAAHNGCGASPTISFQHGQVTGVTWGGCRAGADVMLYTIDGGGHTWPGSKMALGLGLTTQDISATDAIWEFFAAHPKP